MDLPGIVMKFLEPRECPRTQGVRRTGADRRSPTRSRVRPPLPVHQRDTTPVQNSLYQQHTTASRFHPNSSRRHHKPISAKRKPQVNAQWTGTDSDAFLSIPDETVYSQGSTFIVS